MGFWVEIQADYRSEILRNVHPEGKPSGGNAILAFLMGLQNYCGWLDDVKKYSGLENVMAWYQHLELFAGEPFGPVCRPLLDTMWGDGGDPTEYRENEYEFYRHRSDGFTLTEEQFLAMVRESKEHWQPIDKVVDAVRFLLDVFKRFKGESLEGVYIPEDTIPDFEALLANLELLAKRGNKVVRLNFS